MGHICFSVLNGVAVIVQRLIYGDGITGGSTDVSGNINSPGHSYGAGSLGFSSDRGTTSSQRKVRMTTPFARTQTPFFSPNVYVDKGVMAVTRQCEVCQNCNAERSYWKVSGRVTRIIDKCVFGHFHDAFGYMEW